MMQNEEMKTLIAAVYTPFDKAGKVELAKVGDLGRFLKDEGSLDGVFVCGSTGEGLLLTEKERRAVLEEWMPFASADFKVMAHVGHGCLEESVQLAEHAESCGVAGIAALGPLFFKPGTIESLVDFCQRVAAGAPGIPFYYYHVPGITGIRFPMTAFMETAIQRIPNFSGIKFTDEDLFEFAECLDVADGEFDVFFGKDEVMLSALAVGARSFMGGTFPFAAPLYRRLLDHFSAGRIDLARSDQALVRKMIRVLRKFGGRTAGKSAMRLTGVDCGPVRPPMSQLKETEIECLLAEFDAIGLRRSLVRQNRTEETEKARVSG